MALRSRLFVPVVVIASLGLGLVSCSSDAGKVSLSDGEVPAPSGDVGSSGGVGMGGTGPKGNVEDPPADSPKDDRFTYQDDVVFVGGGEEAAVAAASSDGLTYQLRGDAPGVESLQVGSVLYVSPTLAGRVIAMGEQDGDVLVTVGPVDLPEIFREAEFHIDHTYEDDETTIQAYPDYGPGIVNLPPEPEPEIGAPSEVPDGPTTGGTADGTIDPQTTADPGTTAAPDTTVAKLHGRSRAGAVGAATDPDLGDADDVVRVPPLSVTLGAPPAGAPPQIDPNKQLPPKQKSRFTFEAEGWSFAPYVSATSFGVEITRESDIKTKVGVDLSIKHTSLRLIVDTVISGGLYAKNTMMIEGLDGISVDASAGSSAGVDGSTKIALEVPVVDFKAQIPGEPFVYAFKFSVAAGAAFGGNNATISASGLWSLKGPIGIDDGEVLAPELSVVRSLVDSIGGISLGATGLTIGLGVTISVGVGIPMIFAGPFGKIAFDVGIANGSALGSPLATCHQGTLDIWSGGGVGFSISSEVSEWLTKVLGPTAKFKGDASVMANVFHRTVLQPDVPLCGGGAGAGQGTPSAGDAEPN